MKCSAYICEVDDPTGGFPRISTHMNFDLIGVAV